MTPRCKMQTPLRLYETEKKEWVRTNTAFREEHSASVPRNRLVLCKKIGQHGGWLQWHLQTDTTV